MGTIIRVELKKIYRKPRNIIVYILMAFITLAIILGQNSVEESARYYISPEYRAKEAQAKIRFLEGEIIKIRGDQTKSEAQKDQLIFDMEEEITWKEKEISYANSSQELGNYSEDEKKRINDYEIESLEKAMVDNSLLGPMFEASKVYMEAIRNRGYYKDTLAYVSGQSYILNLVNTLSNYALVFLSLIIGMDIVSGEYVNSRILRFSRSPQGKFIMYSGKVMALFIFTLLVHYGIGALGFIYTLVTRGLGPIDFPMALALKNSLIDYNGSPMVFPHVAFLKIIDLKTFTLISILFQVLFVLTLASFIAFVSTMSKKTGIGALIITLLYALLNALPNVFPTLSRSLAHLSFFTYGNSHWLLDGRQASYYLNANINLVNGIIVLVLSTIIFNILGYYFFKMRGFKVEKEEDNNQKRIRTALD